MIQFGCPKCRQVMQVDVRLADQVVACPGCKTAIRAPAAAPVATATPAVPQPLPEAANLGPLVRELHADQDKRPFYGMILGGAATGLLFLLLALYQLAQGDLGIFCILFAFLLVPAAVAAYGVYGLKFAGQLHASIHRDGFVCVTPRETIVLAWTDVAHIRHETHQSFRLGAEVTELDRFEIRCKDGREVVLSESMPFSSELGRLVQQHANIRPK